MTTPGPWAFGWEAVVSFATFGLALVTFLLARHTRRLAKSTAQEAAAQWRPILTPGTDPWRLTVGAPSAVAPLRVGEVTITLTNIGPGPAFATQLGAYPIPGSGGGSSIGQLVAQVIPAGASRTHAFETALEPDHLRPIWKMTGEIVVAYQDLAGAVYHTIFQIYGAVEIGQVAEVTVQDLRIETGAVSSFVSLLQYKPPFGIPAEPLADRARAAWREIWLDTNFSYVPLRTRYRRAWLKLNPPRTKTFSQRARLARYAYGSVAYAGLGQRPEPPENPWWRRRWDILQEAVWRRRRDTWRMKRNGLKNAIRTFRDTR